MAQQAGHSRRTRAGSGRYFPNTRAVVEAMKLEGHSLPFQVQPLGHSILPGRQSQHRTDLEKDSPDPSGVPRDMGSAANGRRRGVPRPQLPSMADLVVAAAAAARARCSRAQDPTQTVADHLRARRRVPRDHWRWLDSSCPQSALR